MSPRHNRYSTDLSIQWNIAIDPSSIQYHTTNDSGIQRGFSNLAADRGPTNWISVKGCEIDWPVKEGVAPDLPPKSPKCVTKKQTYRMIPYGLAKIHMSELPTVKLSRWWGTEMDGEEIGVPSDL